MFSQSINQLYPVAIQLIPAVEKQNLGGIQITDYIALFGIFATLMVALIGFFFNTYQSKRNGITKPRIEWINKIRNITAEVVNYDYNAVHDEKKLTEINEQLMRNSYLLSFYLNITGPFDGVILDYLSDIVNSRRDKIESLTNENFQYARRKLSISMQIYLKAEWERVKWENKLIRKSNYTSDMEEKVIKKLLDNLYQDDNIREIQKKYGEKLSEGKAKRIKPFNERIEIL